MADLSRTSFYGQGRQESLRGPKGEKGDKGDQGQPGPIVPISPAFNTNAEALSAGLQTGTLYATSTGEVRIVI